MTADLSLLPNDQSRRIARLILHNLAHRADDKALVCWPSIETIAKHASASTRTIMRMLPELEEAELILCGRKRRRGNMYMILISDFDEQAISDIAVSLNGGDFDSIKRGISDIVVSLNSKISGRVSDKTSPISDKTGRISDTQMSHEHRTIEHKEKTKNVIQEIPGWLNPESWVDFVEHRASLKAPMSAKAQRLLLKKLTGHRNEGHDPNDLLETAVMNGWKSVYPPKPEKRPIGSRANERIRRELEKSSDESVSHDCPDVPAAVGCEKIGWIG